ncbi:MAG: hypothetical protein RJQ08_08550 [Salinisphaeraceae bacterium]
MADPVLRSRYWVFDDVELTEALDEYVDRQCREKRVSADYAPVLRDAVRDFLASAEVRDRGMSRGGHES